MKAPAQQARRQPAPHPSLHKSIVPRLVCVCELHECVCASAGAVRSVHVCSEVDGVHATIGALWRPLQPDCLERTESQYSPAWTEGVFPCTDGMHCLRVFFPCTDGVYMASESDLLCTIVTRNGLRRTWRVCNVLGVSATHLEARICSACPTLTIIGTANSRSRKSGPQLLRTVLLPWTWGSWAALGRRNHRASRRPLR